MIDDRYLEEFAVLTIGLTLLIVMVVSVVMFVICAWGG